MSDNRLEAVVQQWSTRSAPAEVVALAEAARQRHNGVAAVLFYGSWLRSSRVDEGIADLYLLVDNYYNAFGSHFQALMNRLLPPNVFYLEIPYAEKPCGPNTPCSPLRILSKEPADGFTPISGGVFPSLAA